MKLRFVLLLGTAALLLLSSGALAQPGEGDAVEEGAAAAGTYHLTSLCWQVEGVSSGGDYRLVGPAAPELAGSGCCCAFLPLVLRHAY